MPVPDKLHLMQAITITDNRIPDVYRLHSWLFSYWPAGKIGRGYKETEKSSYYNNTTPQRKVTQMQRRDFIKLGGVGMASLVLPVSGIAVSAEQLLDKPMDVA